jgi:DNA-directed RNA polymerase subunit L
MSEVVPEAEAPREVKPIKFSKIDQKRQQIFADRVRRKMAGGMSEEAAFRAVQQEDYDNMPVDKKLLRFQNAVQAAINNLSRDIMELRHNDQVIADAFDINYKVIERVFAKIGISDEERKTYLEEARKELSEERQRRAEAIAKQQKEAAEAEEKARVEAEAKAADAKTVTPAQAEGSDPDARAAEGATVFGG